jgi:hypothetical protein
MDEMNIRKEKMYTIYSPGSKRNKTGLNQCHAPVIGFYL